MSKKVNFEPLEIAKTKNGKLIIGITLIVAAILVYNHYNTKNNTQTT